MDLLDKFVYEEAFRLEDYVKTENYLCRKFSYSDTIFYTVKLLTYMNLSGSALKIFAKKENIDLSEICVVVDDFNLPYGKFRIRLRGSSGNHKGLQSVIDTFGSDNFARIRIGIGPLQGVAEEFVLQKFNDSEIVRLPSIYENLIKIIEEIVQNGYEKTMNKFNKNENIED